jgi:hypothetical protein
MALKGTIRDFGVADIFQLISQQVKTGVLLLRNDLDEVRVYFKDGSVVRAESATRQAQMLLGSMLVRAETLTQEQLDHALKEQRRTLKPLGSVIIELGYARESEITEFATLQMTETVYGLFQWKNGTYEFEGVPVEASTENVEPVRAENIVMNGIRMVDEWPSIREKLPSYTWMVERVKPLPDSKRDSGGSDDFDLSSLSEEGQKSADLDDIGTYERLVYGLIAPGRDVQKIIDLARLGEFEACRALGALMTQGYIRVVKPSQAAAQLPVTDDVTRTASNPLRTRYFLAAAGRIFVSASLVLIFAMLIGRVSPARFGLDPGGELTYESKLVETHLSESQMRVIRRALEVYRFETGIYPEKLETLVDAGMLTERDIRFPFRRRYFYKVQDGSAMLLPPVH